ARMSGQIGKSEEEERGRRDRAARTLPVLTNVALGSGSRGAALIGWRRRRATARVAASRRGALSAAGADPGVVRAGRFAQACAAGHRRARARAQLLALALHRAARGARAAC